MPTYEITGPDGKTYQITGDTPEGAMQALQAHLGSSGQTSDFNQPVDASTVYVDEMLFGLPGKAAAAMNAGFQAPFSDKTFGELYDEQRQGYNQAREEYAQEHPIANTAAMVGGNLFGGGKVLDAGKLVTSRVAPALAKRLESSIIGRTAADAAGGAAIGATSAYGHDQNIGTGAVVGGVLGGAARPLVEAGGGILGALGGMVGLGNKGRARNAIYEALTRSGKSADEVGNELRAAAAEGQPEFAVVDALGNSGQRMLSGIARAPGDMRQTIAETLQRRQGDQGRRIGNALQEASGTRLTAEQTEQLLKQARSEAAKRNYAPVERDPTAIDVSPAVREANQRISPAADTLATARGDLPTDIASRGAIEGGERALRDPIREALREARSYLASGKLTASNVNKAFRAKTNIDQMIAKATEQGRGGVVDALTPVRDKLDEALARTSKDYAKARDAYKAQSGLVDAVDIGRQAGKGRQLSEDTLNEFGLLSPEQQAPYRAGYFDPLVRRAETSAFGVDKSRPLITDAYAREFPAIAAPGKGEQLMRQLGREQRMFETRNAALGGSRTAENLADTAEMGVFDPSMITAILSGNLKGAAVQGLTRGAQALSGRNQQTRDMIARALLQTSPTKATAEIANAIEAGKKLTRKQQFIVNMLIGGTVPTAARMN